MERGMRRIDLTLSGVAYVLDVYQLSKMTGVGKRRLRAGIRTGEKTFCHNAIEPQHVDKAWAASTQALRLGLVSKKGSVLPVGFALVRKRGKLLHVHLLCAATSDKAKGRSGHAQLDPSPGAVLLSQLEALANRAGVTSLELSAVPYVIDYYRSHGFRHLLPGESGERPEVQVAAKTVAGHRFSSNNELDTMYKIGEAEIDAARRGDGDLKKIAEQLDWTVPEASFQVEGGKIVAYDERDRVDQKLTDMVEKRGEYSEMVAAFMQLKEAGLTGDVSPQAKMPVWDKATGDVDIITDDTFLMAKRLGKGRARQTRRTRRTRRKRGRKSRRRTKRN
jgi:hypothetical protein